MPKFEVRSIELARIVCISAYNMVLRCLGWCGWRLGERWYTLPAAVSLLFTFTIIPMANGIIL